MTAVARFFTGKSRSRVYAILYLACIPSFAGLYSLIPSDFHHTMVRYEKSLAEDLEVIRRGVEKDLNVHVRSQHGGRRIVDHGWTVVSKTIRVSNPMYQDGAFRFSLVIALEKDGEHGPERLSGNLTEMSLGLESTPIINDQGELNYYLKKVEFDGESFVEFDPYTLLSNPPAWVRATGKPPRIPFLPIAAPLQDRLGAYARGIDGFPASSSGTFGRMLYLSAVTVTTLGYGDILPISMTARALVACEAVGGIVLIGLYLASLSSGIEGSRGHQAAGPDPDPDPSAAPMAGNARTSAGAASGSPTASAASGSTRSSN